MLRDMKMKWMLACLYVGILVCGGCRAEEHMGNPDGGMSGQAALESREGRDSGESDVLRVTDEAKAEPGISGMSGEGLSMGQKGAESQDKAVSGLADTGGKNQGHDPVQGTQISVKGEPSGEREPAPADSSEEEKLSLEVEEYLGRMTLEEKAAQLFIVLPEALMKVDRVTAAGETTKNAVNEIPVGGFIYMAGNLVSAEQVKGMLSNVQSFSMERLGLPAFLSVDEEGGTVTRISGKGRFDVPDIGDMADIGLTGDTAQARQTGVSIGSYLAELGFNLDFAPVADVLSNPDNTVVKRRSFGDDPRLVSDMALALAEGLGEKGIISTFKHFPGHGATAGDTHAGYAFTDKTLEELAGCELVPFQRCIDENAGFVMVGHISLPGVIGDDTPASLSSVIIDGLLRGKMGYDGVVVTDALDMGAIVQQYSSAEAAVKVLQAGGDMILMPENFEEAYEGVLSAVKDGTLPQERLDQSLRRILKVKLKMKHRMEGT